MKAYDKAYFDRWYRSSEHRIGGRAELVRSVSLAVAQAESVLERPVRSILDVGAGEGRWQPVLARLRPAATYLGVEPSAWAVAHWRSRRHLVRGDLERLPSLGIPGPFDLVVCADVLHYLPNAALERGLLALAPFVAGVAWCPTFTRADSIDGDRVGFQTRSAEQYHAAFRHAGLVPIGLHGWVSRDSARGLSELELPGR